MNNNPNLEFDHSVHYVNDLDRVTETFQSHGVNVFHGGSHKLWGTHNALSYFGLTYLEFISVEDWEVAKNPPEPNLIAQSALTYLPENEALSRVAIRTSDLDAVAASLEGSSLDVSPIINGSRTDKNGRLIEWRMMTIDGEYNGLPYPFFIEWKEADADRLKDFQNKGITEHPAGPITLESAVFEVSNPEAAATHWHTLFNLERSGEAALSVGDKTFIFTKGRGNRLTELRFRTANEKLHGKLTVGNGTYVFIKDS